MRLSKKMFLVEIHPKNCGYLARELMIHWTISSNNLSDNTSLLKGYALLAYKIKAYSKCMPSGVVK